MYNTSKSPTTNPEPMTFTRKIGSTDFEIAVYFSQTNKETLNDKIMRLIKSETTRKEVRKI
ncbi:hypothetical protein FACS1894208_06560 [Clostridia bacterium]|nr:hypothetical protein FACS1894208_06560 [Clostridia bacterium]